MPSFMNFLKGHIETREIKQLDQLRGFMAGYFDALSGRAASAPGNPPMYENGRQAGELDLNGTMYQILDVHDFD